MSIIFMATGLSAVAASALTVGALALRQHLTMRAEARQDELSPIQAFASEYAALTGVTDSLVIADANGTTRWNTVRLDDPHKTLAQISALQTRLTGLTGPGPERFNTSIALSGDKSDDA